MKFFEAIGTVVLRVMEEFGRVFQTLGRVIGWAIRPPYDIPELFRQMVRVAARTEGMVTDPVYEGKSMAGLIDLVTRGEIAKTSTVLYAHLGGQPALNAYSAII